MSEEIVLSDRNVPRPPLQEELTRLYSTGFLTDITLSTEDGKNFEAHRILLAARSSYFHSIVPRLKSEPVIFLKGIKGAHLDKILKFIYGSGVAVSKHQLKPILEVAKVLQVKGLQDVTPNDILSRQSVVSAGKFKPDSPLASPLLTKMTSHSAKTNSTLVDKTTLTTFKPLSGRRGLKSSTLTSPEHSRNLQNGSPVQNSDSEKEGKEESETEEAIGTRTRKRGRGRPPKRVPGKDPKVLKEDPYEFEEETESGGKYQPGDRKSKSAQDEEISDNDSDDNDDEEPKRSAKYTINGKQILPVKCKGELADLYLSKFISGVRGHSIKYRDQWMTPQEFEMVCGYSGKKYLENIQTDYGPLKALTASGMLKPFNTRSLRKREDESPKNSPDKRGKRKKKKDAEDEELQEGEESQQQPNEDSDHDKDTSDIANTSTNEQGTITEKVKKKKKKHRDDWKKQLKTESAAIVAASSGAFANATFSMTEEHPPQIQQERNDQNAVVISAANSFAMSLDQPPKISPSAILPEQQTQTLYVMSPHPSMSAPPTPQHNPFASAMSPTPLPTVQTLLPAASHTTTTSGVGTSIGTSGSGFQIKTSQTPTPTSSVSRIGNIMNVRCKSTTALLYANKYESGSKGKCIQLGDEWLTPNEFEDRAGSKAKKYLSSIKCMGRPLRVYVNSGELRGTGKPPQPKGPKKNKFVPLSASQANISAVASQMTPIAPAPIQAPPTPSHISSAPQIPTNLSMVMNAQPPILLNQQQIPSSIMTTGSIMPGMTFTIAQPLEVRQSTQGLTNL